MRLALSTAALLMPALWLAGAVAAAGPKAAPGSARAFVPSALLSAASDDPNGIFEVIVQGRGNGTDVAAAAVREAAARARGRAVGLKRSFTTIDGAAAELTGAQLLELAESADVLSITADAPLVAAGNGNGSRDTSTCAICYQGLYWPYLAGVTSFWPSTSKKAAPPPQAPAIAVVDSGVDASNIFFSGRVVKEVSLVSSGPNAPGDSYGHGTLVAGLAAGSVGKWGGASPTSKIVSLDVVNDLGEASTSDVIAAADWIYQNKDVDGIRVAILALVGTQASSFMYDPLDRAVERLWFSGVVVVASAGNYGAGSNPSGVLYAPANDPFVITVGATDMNGTLEPTDDFPAPWSAYGYTHDGFSKPELSAPGRYMIGPVPISSLMSRLRPDRWIADGWMWMSGTSFAAPVVAGAAADVLAVRPTWTPDQVKGALMVSAQPVGAGLALSKGVGQVHAAAAAAVTDPPNPNLALTSFLVPDPNGGSVPVFDTESWSATAASDPTWDAISWAAANWTSANWTSANWTSASWTSANWTSANWTSANWTSNSMPADVQLSLTWLP